MMKFYPPPHVHWNPNCLMVKPTPSASQPRLDAFLRIFHLRATAYGNLSQLWHSSWHMVHQNCDVPWATTSDTSASWWFQPLWKIWVRQLGWLFPIYIYGNIKHVPNHQPECWWMGDFSLSSPSVATLPLFFLDLQLGMKSHHWTYCRWR